MAWYDSLIDWGGDIVGDVWDWGGDVYEDVSDWFPESTPAIPDLLSPTAGGSTGGFIGPLTQYGTQYGGGLATGMLSDLLGYNLQGNLGVNDANLFSGLKSLYQTDQAQDLAQQQLAQYADIEALGDEYGMWSQERLDPLATQRRQDARLTNIMEQASPYIEKATYSDLYKDTAAGMSRSTPADWREQQRARDVAQAVSNVWAPMAERQDLAETQAQETAYKNRLAMLQGQPQFMTDKQTGAFGINPAYANLQQTANQGLLSGWLGGYL